MKLSMWVPLAVVVVSLGLLAGVVGSLVGVCLMVFELLADGGEWDGIGYLLGLLILCLALPLSISSGVMLRLLRRPDPAPGIVGTAVAVALLALSVASGPGLLWAVPGTGFALLTVAVVATRFSAQGPSAR